MVDFKKKRRVPRRKIKQRVGVLVAGEYSITEAHEMGEGGMKISYDGRLEVGQRIVVTFSVEGVAKAIATAVIRYSSDKSQSPVYYGMEFVSLDFKVKRLIRNFVASWREKDPQKEGFNSIENRKPQSSESEQQEPPEVIELKPKQIERETYEEVKTKKAA